jgi:hypothetical protein
MASKRDNYSYNENTYVREQMNSRKTKTGKYAAVELFSRLGTSLLLL